MQSLNGECLCGAVTVTAAAADVPRLRACHCDMCRRHNSGMFLTVETEPSSVVFQGPVQVFQSSAWAERGFCGACGSTLFYRKTHDGHSNLAAGLFPNAGNGEMQMEFFADACPEGYAFAGDHTRLSTKETIALFAPEEGA